MSFLSEAILRADAQLQARLSVDVGLAQIVEQAEQAGQSGGPGGAATAARRLLVERLRALDETQSQIRRLADALAHFAKVLPFSADGWPEQRARFASLATGPPDQALVDWLDYWFVAASRRRLDALDRLHAEAPLPPGAELLRERADTAARALREPNARLAAPMLTLGCRGLVLGGRRIPDDGTRQDLALLRARLALGEILVDEAAAVLPEDTHSAAALALRARRARMAGDPDADSLLSEAQSADPRDLDVTVELIHRARQRGEFEIALEAAREAVDALQSLADVDAELGRLVHEPAELWLAVADRARRQGDDTAAIRFLDRASEVAAWGDGEVAAVIDEARAGLLADSEERRRALVDAGAQRVQLGHLELAKQDFEAAAAGEPADAQDSRLHASALLRWADVVATLADRRPFRLVADEVSSALDALLDAQRHVDAAGAESWSYMTEADLRLQLARPVGADRAEHQWAAVRASARCVALAPTAAPRWRNLADSAWSLGLFRVAEAAAAQAYALEPDESYRAEHVRALMNLGEYRAGLERLGDADDPWSECVRGYGVLRLGDPRQAIRYLAGVTIDPTWDWAWASYVTALALDGQLPRAREESRTFLRAVSDRAGERDALRATALDARIQGRPAEAIGPARQLHEASKGEEGWGALGSALVLTGDATGWKVMADGLARSVDPTELTEWETLTRPLLELLAADLGLPPLGFDALDPVLDAFRARLAEGIDVRAELRNAAALPSAPAGASAVADLVAAVLAVGTEDGAAAGHGAAAEDLLGPLAGAGLPAEVDSLRRYAADRARGRANREPAEPEADPPGSDGGTEPELRMELPVSWFAGVPDPVNEHPLFLRYLPEVRLRADWEVPPVRVSTADDLEPGGYRILVGDEVVQAGQLDPALRYGSQDDLALLLGIVAGGAAPEPTRLPEPTPPPEPTLLSKPAEYGWTVPADLPGDPGLLELLTMPAVEVAARRYGEATKSIEPVSAPTPTS